MTGEACISQLKAENAALPAEVKALRKQLAWVLARQHERKRSLRKDSHNSSKPPSPDGPTRKTRSRRIKSGRKVGGQQCHPGSTLPLMEQPGEVLLHRPARCTSCQHPLECIPGEIVGRGQVQDLPAWRLVESRTSGGAGLLLAVPGDESWDISN
jgi:transposase